MKRVFVMAAVALVPAVALTAYVILTSGGGGDAGGEAPSSASADVSGDRGELDPFLYADVETGDREPPERRWPELPTEYAAFEEEYGGMALMGPAHADFAALRVRLGAGQPEPLEAIVEALRTAAGDGTLEGKLASFYESTLEEPSSDAFCDRIQGAIEEADEGPVRDVLWHGLKGCSGSQYLEFLQSREAPAEVVVEWYRSQSKARGLAFPESLAERVRNWLDADWDHRASAVAEALVRVEHPRGLELIDACTEEAGDAERARFLSALGAHPNLAITKRYREGCRHPDFESEFRCRTFRERGVPAPGEGVRSSRVDDVVAYVEWHDRQREEIVESLAGCVRGGAETSTSARERCLRRLALVDWERARNVEGSVPAESGTAESLKAALRRFDSREALIEWARENGFVSDDRLEPHETRRVATLPELLRAAGRGTRFDTETGVYPNRHDGLLIRLAHLGGGVLAEARFEETAPDDPRDHESPYRLHAFVDGESLTAEARNLGDWYDVAAVLGLLNRLLERKESSLRFATLPTDDQTSRVALVPRDGFVEAVRTGLLRIGSPDAGRRAGIEFEREVRRELKDAGSLEPLR